jgi:hypothetical protein
MQRIQIGNGGGPADARVETPIGLFFIRGIAAPTTVAVQPSIDDRDLQVVDATNFTTLDGGTYTGVFNPLENRFYFGNVTAINGNTLTFDTPLDFAFLAGDNVQPLSRDLNVNGLITPVTFQVRGSGPGSGLSINITRLMVAMECDTRLDLNKFGDISPALTNGLVLRRANGVTRNIFNLKRNSDFITLAYDLQMFDATNPAQGVNGLASRNTYNGEDKRGTVLQLLPGDSLDLIVQDDLSSLEIFQIQCHGYESRICCTPEVIDIPADGQMHIVAENIVKGFIHTVQTRAELTYLQTYRATGDTAPTDFSDSIQWVARQGGIPINTSTGVDVYIGVVGNIPGKIRLDL